jgi:hypothetical protein
LKLLVEPARSRRRLAYLVGAFALLASSLLMIAGRASADLVYWANGSNSIAYSQLDDKAGGFLPASVNALHNAEGTAIDTDNGRIYVSQEASNQIVWFALDGLHSGVVNTAPGSVDHPTNIAIDPETQTLYWANADDPGSIGYARVDETGSGIFAEPGSSSAKVEGPTRIAIETLHHRVYWWNELGEKFSWLTMNGLESGNLVTPGLNLSGAAMGGIAVEPYSTPQELYFMNDAGGGIYHTDPLLGGLPEEVQGAVTDKSKNTAEPTGLAFDGTDNRFYWANRQTDEEPHLAIGTATLFGQPSTITVFPVAPIHAPGFASILKAPVSAGAPQLTAFGATLSCTLGEWEGDHPGASVYAAPTNYDIQWKRGSTVIAGANESSFTATETGSYSCEVVGLNAAGETGKASRPTTVTIPKPPDPPASSTTPKSKASSSSSSGSGSKPTPASVGAKLASSKPVKAKAGGAATIEVELTNSGETTSDSAKVCGGQLSKGAKKGLKPPKCVTVKSVAAGKTVAVNLMVATKASARGAYKLSVEVSGATTQSLTAKVQITRPKRK